MQFVTLLTWISSMYYLIMSTSVFFNRLFPGANLHMEVHRPKVSSCHLSIALLSRRGLMWARCYLAPMILTMALLLTCLCPLDHNLKISDLSSSFLGYSAQAWHCDELEFQGAYLHGVEPGFEFPALGNVRPQMVNDSPVILTPSISIS